MKKIFLFPFLLFSICIMGQSQFEKTYFSQAFNDTFKNESVVIVRMMDESTYTNYGIDDYKVNVVFRAQYLLKDISAISNFSTLLKNNDLKRYELKQIKPNGKVNTIYEYFDKNYPDDGYDKPENQEEDEEKKKEEIPLEGLEIGDIIDYKYEYTFTTKSKDFRKISINNGKFDHSIIEIINHNRNKYLIFKNKFVEESYPIASSVTYISVPSELKLIQKSFNCGYKFTEKSNAGKTTYECNFDLVKAFKSEDFSYNYLHHPVVKYALIQTDNSKKPNFSYQFEDPNVSEEDIVSLGRKFYQNKNYIPKFLYYLNTQKSSEAYTEVSLNKFFSAFLSTFTKNDKDKYSKLNKLHEYLVNEDELNQMPYGDMAYTVVMARFCDKLGIKYKMMASLNRYDGPWADIISPYEITWGLYIPRKEKDLYVNSYTKESNIYQRFGSYSGTDLIVFDPKDNTKPSEKIKYPMVSASENLYIQNSEITKSDDKEYDYTFVNTYSMSGSQKDAISDYIRSQFDYERLRTPYNFFGLVNYSDLYNFKEFSSNEEWFEEANRIDSSYRLYFKDYYKGRMLAFLYNEYQFSDISIDSMRIFEDGNYPDDESKDYGFKVVFKTKGLIEKSSNESILVLNLGKLMTEQYQLSDYKVEERISDVYNSNLKEIHWNNSIDIPEGYECINLDDFNFTFENAAGIFKTTATIEDGKIVFKIEKTYKTHYLPKENWMDMVNFLHTAEKVFMKKLILKKK